MDPKAERRERLKLQRRLHELTGAVALSLARLDAEMRRPGAPVDRGKRIAAIANALDVANDAATHFGLGKSFPWIMRRKRNAAAVVADMADHGGGKDG